MCRCSSFLAPVQLVVFSPLLFLPKKTEKGRGRGWNEMLHPPLFCPNIKSHPTSIAVSIISPLTNNISSIHFLSLMCNCSFWGSTTSTPTYIIQANLGSFLQLLLHCTSCQKHAKMVTNAVTLKNTESELLLNSSTILAIIVCCC